MSWFTNLFKETPKQDSEEYQRGYNLGKICTTTDASPAYLAQQTCPYDEYNSLSYKRLYFIEGFIDGFISRRNQ